MDKSALEGLLERVEKADGPDRDIDAALSSLLLGLQVKREPGRRKWRHGKRGGQWLVLPDHTASIDAALSLMDQTLPEHDWVLGHTNGGLTIHCQLGPDKDSMAFGKAPALAVLSALLRALIERADDTGSEVENG